MEKEFQIQTESKTVTTWELDIEDGVVKLVNTDTDDEIILVEVSSDGVIFEGDAEELTSAGFEVPWNVCDEDSDDGSDKDSDDGSDDNV